MRVHVQFSWATELALDSGYLHSVQAVSPRREGEKGEYSAYSTVNHITIPKLKKASFSKYIILLTWVSTFLHTEISPDYVSCMCLARPTPSDFLSGKMQLSPPAVKLQ